MKYIDIELALVAYFGNRTHIIVPNCYINLGTNTDHECDLLIIKKSGYAVEVEIKMSKADMKADFKKKHGHIDNRLQHLYYAMPIDIYEQCKDLIPEYAGVIIIYTYNNSSNLVVSTYARLVKKAPKKECRKLTIEEQLKFARLGVMRIWNLKEQHQNQQVLNFE